MDTLEKIDLQKTDQAYYKASLKPQILQFPDIGYIAISGKGSPDSHEFSLAIQTIYKVAYKLKNISKLNGRDFKVAKMEAFWWLQNGHDFENTPKDQWFWQILIRMPEYINEEDLKTAKSSLEDEQSTNTTMWHIEPAGEFIHILHIGSYFNEKESIEKIMNHVKENQKIISGHHREIYLTDPRKTSEDRLRTILIYRIQ